MKIFRPQFKKYVRMYRYHTVYRGFELPDVYIDKLILNLRHLMDLD